MNEPRHRTYEGDVYGAVYNKAGGGNGGWFTDTAATAAAQEKAGQYSIKQGQELSASGQPRGDAPAPDAWLASYEHQEMYDAVQAASPEEIDDRGRFANNLGNKLAELQAQADRAAANEQAVWKGEAAARARDMVRATGDWMGQTADAAWLASNQFSQQSAAAANAKNSMPEPVPFDQAAEMNTVREKFSSGGFLGMGSFSDGMNAMLAMQQKQQAAQAAHEQAVRVMDARDTTYHSTASAQPAFAPPPSLEGTGATAAASAGGPPIGQANISTPTPGGTMSGAGTPGPGGAPGTGPGAAPPNVPRAAGPGLGAGFLPPVAPAQAGDTTRRGPRPGAPAGPRVNPGARPSTGGATPPRPGRSAANSGSGRGGAIGGKPVGTPSSKPGAIPLKPGPGAGAGAGAKGEAPGRGSGSGAAVRGAEAARGAAGTTGAKGAGVHPGMAPGPAGRGRGDDDTERKAPGYLKDADPDETFGATNLRDAEGHGPTAPVIGEK